MMGDGDSQLLRPQMWIESKERRNAVDEEEAKREGKQAGNVPMTEGIDRRLELRRDAFNGE